MMLRCTRCLYPQTKPDLQFNAEGICSACQAFDARQNVDWAARKTEIELLLEQGKNGSGFDCIVPSSGGKDSTAQVLKLIELGARPLVVTASTCYLTEVGRHNIDNLAKLATTIEVTANRTVRAKLNRIGLRLVGDISYPEHASIFSVPFKIATYLGIPLIFYGESPTREYGGPPKTDELRVMNRRWVSEHGGLLGLRASDLIGQDGITAGDMQDYTLPSDDAMKNTTAFFLGQFFPWSSRENADKAKRAGLRYYMPSRANWWDFENLDNAMTGIHDYFCWLKYGFGRATAQLSVDIRNGYIDRKRALEFAEQRDGEYPSEYMGVSLSKVLEHIGVNQTEFDSICARFTNRKIFGVAA